MSDRHGDVKTGTRARKAPPPSGQVEAGSHVKGNSEQGTMNECDYVGSRTSFYLDDELRAEERRAFEEHLDRCQDCRSAVSSERRFLESVRQAGPLYEAPVDLRRRIEELASRGGLRDASAADLGGRGPAAVPVPVSGLARFGKIQRVASVSGIGILLALL